MTSDRESEILDKLAVGAALELSQKAFEEATQIHKQAEAFSLLAARRADLIGKALFCQALEKILARPEAACDRPLILSWGGNGIALRIEPVDYSYSPDDPWRNMGTAALAAAGPLFQAVFG